MSLTEQQLLCLVDWPEWAKYCEDQDRLRKMFGVSSNKENQGLKHREKLLSDVATQLQQHNIYIAQVANIRVRLYQGDTMVKEYLGLNDALDAIVNNIYWDGVGNWSEANKAVVDSY